MGEERGKRRGKRRSLQLAGIHFEGREGGDESEKFGWSDGGRTKRHNGMRLKEFQCFNASLSD